MNMKRLFEFVENDRIAITSIRTTIDKVDFFESIGLFKGTRILLFLKDKKRVIIKIGKTKFALSEEIAGEIFGEKI